MLEKFEDHETRVYSCLLMHSHQSTLGKFFSRNFPQAQSHRILFLFFFVCDSNFLAYFCPGSELMCCNRFWWGPKITNSICLINRLMGGIQEMDFCLVEFILIISCPTSLYLLCIDTYISQTIINQHSGGSIQLYNAIRYGCMVHIPKQSTSSIII